MTLNYHTCFPLVITRAYADDGMISPLFMNHCDEVTQSEHLTLYHNVQMHPVPLIQNPVYPQAAVLNNGSHCIVLQPTPALENPHTYMVDNVEDTGVVPSMNRNRTRSQQQVSPLLYQVPAVPEKPARKHKKHTGSKTPPTKRPVTIDTSLDDSLEMKRMKSDGFDVGNVELKKFFKIIGKLDIRGLSWDLSFLFIYKPL